MTIDHDFKQTGGFVQTTMHIIIMHILSFKYKFVFNDGIPTPEPNRET